MKCCVLIMADNRELSARNLNAIYQTYVKEYNLNKSEFDNEYEFYYYTGGYDKFDVIDNHIHCVSPDDLYGTFDKTVEAFKYCLSMEPDFIIRTNISTYINIRLLDKCLSILNKNSVYCNKICTYLDDENILNKFYPRGDAYIIHKDLLSKCIKCLEDYDPKRDYMADDKYDDVLFGLLLLRVFGDDFIHYIKPMNYNCFLGNTIDAAVYNCIFSRLKTCPPNSYSGYSWDDNEYRLHDTEKFISIDKYYNLAKNDIINCSITEADLLANYDDTDYVIKIDNELYATSLNIIKRYNLDKRKADI